MTRKQLVLIGVAVAALALAGCGRKGMLEPPPSASALGTPQSVATDSGLGEPEHSALEGERVPGAPVSAPPKRNSFPLDFLLN